MRLHYRMIGVDHPIGPIHMVADGGMLVALEFGAVDDRLMPMLDRRFGTALDLRAGDDLDCLADPIRAYLDGALDALDDIPADGGGTEFQRSCWSALRTIPPGETRTYGQLAAALGRPGSARAVGSANALNPVSLVVPCHRLVGSTGSLTGYGGGMARKRWLLDHEARWTKRR
ncbi:MAG: methylated-DNA--[protein]-cysteine S-methyltransferase [Rhizobiaceae bacterium]|nr:methylated-DNA--[protein]-cysteine S-methyltransferase [Rhizobiaceae bacterium]